MHHFSDSLEFLCLVVLICAKVLALFSPLLTSCTICAIQRKLQNLTFADNKFNLIRNGTLLIYTFIDLFNWFFLKRHWKVYRRPSLQTSVAKLAESSKSLRWTYINYSGVTCSARKRNSRTFVSNVMSSSKSFANGRISTGICHLYPLNIFTRNVEGIADGIVTWRLGPRSACWFTTFRSAEIVSHFRDCCSSCCATCSTSSKRTPRPTARSKTRNLIYSTSFRSLISCQF